VAPFDLDTAAADRAYRIVQAGFVALYTDTADVEGWLAEHGYRLVRLAAGDWRNQADFHRDVAAALDFPDYYGNNLDAFNDCLRDIAMSGSGAATGTVLVFTGYEAFTRREGRAAQIILDIIAKQAREAALFGHRMLCLVQSNDRELTFAPVGATTVRWA
jgi:RNAse (barnase) inhibitor barstar